MSDIISGCMRTLDWSVETLGHEWKFVQGLHSFTLNQSRERCATLKQLKGTKYGKAVIA